MVQSCDMRYSSIERYDIYIFNIYPPNLGSKTAVPREQSRFRRSTEGASRSLTLARHFFLRFMDFRPRSMGPNKKTPSTYFVVVLQNFRAGHDHT